MKAEMSGDDFRNRVERPAAGQGSGDQGSPRQVPRVDPATVERAWAPEGGGDGASWQSEAQTPPYAGDGVSDVSGGAGEPAGAPPKRRFTALKVIGMLVAGCFGVSLLTGMVALGVLMLGLSSCVASCSDNPVGDSREHAAYIADLKATDDDLATFDALYGCIDSLQTTRARYDAKVPTADEIRAEVAAGRWPKDDGSAHSPRVWVRIAELSRDYLQDETGEFWEIVDFSYPFPDNGPVPVPATRDESSFTVTRLLCTRGQDVGLYATVQYYRWRSPAEFGNTLDDDRAGYAERVAQLQAVTDAQLLGDRRFLFAGRDLYIWERDENDELRDPAAFVAMANELATHMEAYADITLLEASTPIYVGYDPLHGNYPNRQPVDTFLTTTFPGTRERMLKAGSYLYLDHAAGDELLSVYPRRGEAITEDDLRGALSAATAQSDRKLWRGPDEGSLFDEQMADEVALMLGQPDTNRLIVTSCLDVSDSWSDELRAWVIAPREVMAEDPAGFCRQADQVLDAFWKQAPQDPERRTLVYVHIYVLDEGELRDGSGSACTFADLREAARVDPTSLGSYEPAVLLNVMQYDSRWEGEDERYHDHCAPSDVKGPIARSRAWHEGVLKMDE